MDRSSIGRLVIRLDHTIIEVLDQSRSVAFYRDVLGLEHRGRSGPFEVMLVTTDLALDLHTTTTPPMSRHLAFALDRPSFEVAFERIRTSGTVYGDGPSRTTNMRGPGRSSGVHGATDSVYFADPDGHILEILTYEPV